MIDRSFTGHQISLYRRLRFPLSNDFLSASDTTCSDVRPVNRRFYQLPSYVYSIEQSGNLLQLTTIFTASWYSDKTLHTQMVITRKPYFSSCITIYFFGSCEGRFPSASLIKKCPLLNAPSPSGIWYHPSAS